MKNVLVITGSPRKGGNSDLMAEAFIKGTEKKGHTVMRFDAGRKNVGGCKACDTCWSKGRPCSFDDDFNELESMLEKADCLVLVSPVYYFTFTAQIKAVIDKLYAYTSANCPKPLKWTESVLLACAGDDRPIAFSGMIEAYKLIGEYLNLKDRGIVAATEVYARDDIKKTDYLEKAEKLGAAL
ncbi:flavodoxin family protein [Deltaproteobacteria bacterium Smac51]|nr:flavodoxin family protein [Deltaproteobacteria bacterium Smac51]